MDETVFIPDKKDRNLPAYTEWGYNSFGARYGQYYFLVTNIVDPCKIIYQDGILHFYLNGSLTGNVTAGNYDRENMTLIFSFPFSPVSTYADLVSLNGFKIDLPNESCTITLNRNYETIDITPQGGRLFFKRTQLLYIDGEKDRTILSGYFDLQFLVAGKTEKITDGRFDLGINKDFQTVHIPKELPTITEKTK
jgi:hypothetical protein